MNKLAVLALVVLIACQQDDILTTFSDDEVDHMLTNGSSKAWFRSSWTVDGQSFLPENCSDSLFWVMKVSGDTVVGHQYTYDPVCLFFDTLYMGKLNAGFDSLNFIKGGETYFKSPDLIRPQTFTITFSESNQEHTYTFVKSEFGVMSRQVASYLTDGEMPGDSLEWALTSLSIDNIRQPLSECEDSLRWVFYRTSLADIRLAQLTPSAGCLAYSSVDMGLVTVLAEGGLFEGLFRLDGEETDSITISTFTRNSFSATYSLTSEDDKVYKATFAADR